MSSNQINNSLNSQDLEDFFINLTPQISLFSYEIKENLKLFKMLCSNYNIQLKNILILSRQLDLIEFFNNIEKQLLYFNNCFKNIPDIDIRKYITNQVLNYRKINLNNIQKYIY